MECLLEGLDTVFRHIGAVPEELWFDNTKTIVTKVIRGGKRQMTERFDRFAEHYRMHAVFMNPGEVHEKGNVENKVGYHRRNLLVPIPRFQSLAEKTNGKTGSMLNDDGKESLAAMLKNRKINFATFRKMELQFYGKMSCKKQFTRPMNRKTGHFMCFKTRHLIYP